VSIPNLVPVGIILVGYDICQLNAQRQNMIPNGNINRINIIKDIIKDIQPQPLLSL